MEYAGFWRRVAAFLIDNVVLFLQGIVLGSVIYFIFGDANENISDAIVSIFSIVVAWLYFTLLESSNLQATIGK